MYKNIDYIAWIMCGIVGLFSKTRSIENRLGELLSRMLIEMAERGPDSTGIAVYRDRVPEAMTKITLLSPVTEFDWEQMLGEMCRVFPGHNSIKSMGNHAVVTTTATVDLFREWLAGAHPELLVNSTGAAIEIYKEKGLPSDVIDRFGVAQMQGTHALGHTRMATESAVTTEHSHPFSTGADLCLVHNGSLSNHNRLRELLKKQGIEFSTDNDSEVAAGYLTWRMREGASLDEALQLALRDLDGFYTFAIGTGDGFAVLRDPIACKPAVMAETTDWVAMASEYRAIAVLPGAEQAECWEPEPAKIYSWSH